MSLGPASTPAASESRLDEALKVARRFGPVLPLRGKRPLTRHGVDDATRDVRQIRMWWTSWPDADIGLATGSGSVEVLDVDPGGSEALAALVREYGPLPETRQHRTARGVHFLFAPSGIPNTVSRLGAHLDTKGAGGYVKWWPLSHDAPLAAAPAWLVALARGGDPIADAEAAVSAAPEGKRNLTLNREAFIAARTLDHERAVETEERLVKASTLPRAEAVRTARSGLEAGLAAGRRERRRWRVLPVSLWVEPRFRRTSPEGKAIFFALLSGPFSTCIPGVAVGCDEKALADLVGIPERHVRLRLRELNRGRLLRVDRLGRVYWLVSIVTAHPPWSTPVAVNWLKAVDEHVGGRLKADILAALRRGPFGSVFAQKTAIDSRGRRRLLKNAPDTTRDNREQFHGRPLPPSFPEGDPS